MSGLLCFFFFFNDTATTEIYTLSLHDALPISHPGAASRDRLDRPGRALQRRTVRSRRERVARQGARGGARARGGRGNRVLHPRLGRRSVPRAAARLRAPRAAPRLGRVARRGPARPLGGATGPTLRGRGPPARRPRDRGGAAHGPVAVVVAAR